MEPKLKAAVDKIFTRWKEMPREKFFEMLNSEMDDTNKEGRGMIPILQGMIEDALKEANEQYPKSREMALVITKLEEALMWFKARK